MREIQHKRLGRGEFSAVIGKRETFRNSTGSLRGVKGFEGVGRLPKTFQRDSLKRATYVVYSYATPLAWVHRGRWYYPEVTYSPTTSQHQHAVRMGMTGKPCHLRSEAKTSPREVPLGIAV